jgi:tRNA(adenine34) deaminase
LEKKSIDVDIFFMKKALQEAKKAFDKDEVPIGAIVVAPDGKLILSKSHNLTEQKKCQSAHAEVLAIEKACKKMGDWRLNDCTIYITLEPCAMCMNLILLSRIKKVVFALESKLYGFSIDKYSTFELYKCPMQIRKDICMQESLDLLQLFFKRKRIKQQ